MRAWRQIWDSARWIASLVGRIRVLAWAFVIVSALLLAVWVFLRDRVGILGLVVLALAAVLLAVGISGAWAQVKERYTSRSRLVEPEIVREDRGFPSYGLHLKEAWHFEDDDPGHALGKDFIVVEMRYTNKEPERINLNAEVQYQLIRYGQRLGTRSRLSERTTRPLRDQFSFPLHVEKRSTVTGLIVCHVDSLAFDFHEWHGITPRWETETTLVLEEYISGKRLEARVPFGEPFGERLKRFRQ